MKIKVGELLAKRESIEKLVDTKTPAVVSFKLAKIVRVVNEELTTFDKTKNDLVKKYSKEKNDEGEDFITVDSPEMDEFMKEFDPLVNSEVELEFTPITLKASNILKIPV